MSTRFLAPLLKQPILTPTTAAGEFWPAEDHHQDYYKKNPVKYKIYVTGCGRYARLDELWGKLRKSVRRLIARHRSLRPRTVRGNVAPRR